MRINVKTCTGRKGEQFLHDLAYRIEGNLPRFGRRITNLDVLIIDDAQGVAKGCVMEAQLPDMEPIAVTARASTFERAVTVGAQKIEEIAGEKLGAGPIANTETLEWIPEGFTD